MERKELEERLDGLNAYVVLTSFLQKADRHSPGGNLIHNYNGLKYILRISQEIFEDPKNSRLEKKWELSDLKEKNSELYNVIMDQFLEGVNKYKLTI